MSDDELRDDFGRDIARTLRAEPDAGATTRRARERVRSVARGRVVTRRTAAVAVVVAIVAGTFALTRGSDYRHIGVATKVPTSFARCAPADAASVVWNGVRYRETQPLLHSTGVLRIGKTCGGHSVWRLALYRERAAIGVGSAGLVRVYTARLPGSYYGAAVFDFAHRGDGDIVRFDVSEGGFPKRIMTAIVPIRILVKLLLEARASHSPVSAAAGGITVAMHLRDGAISEVFIQRNSQSTGQLTVAYTTLLSYLDGWYNDAARYVPQVASAGIAVVHGHETWLYDDAGHQVSVLPTVAGVTAAQDLAVPPTGSYRLTIATPVKPPRPAGLSIDCTTYEEAGGVAAAICGSSHRAELITPGNSNRAFQDIDSNGTSFVHPVASAFGRALFTLRAGDCARERAVILDRAHQDPISVHGAIGIGWTHDGRAIVAFDKQCSDEGSVQLVDANGRRTVIIGFVPPGARVYRWFWPGASN